MLVFFVPSTYLAEIVVLYLGNANLYWRRPPPVSAFTDTYCCNASSVAAYLPTGTSD